MAEIVLGLATSHSPQLNTGPEWWPSHAERDKTNPRLFDAHGVIHRYDDRGAMAGALRRLPGRDHAFG